MLYIQIFVISIIVFKCFNLIFLKVSRDDSSSAAIVMALGIFLVGAIKEFPYLEDHFGTAFTILLISLWILIISSYIETTFKGFFKKRYLRHPIKSFGIGTWVASSSIVGVVLSQKLPSMDSFIPLLLLVTFALWIFYLFISALSLRAIVKNKLFNNIHGVILLPAVSTQSIVILYSEIFSANSQIIWAIQYWGLLLYFIGFCFIFYRYARFRQWSIVEDWNNTNCILHGALSITGIAGYLSGSMSLFSLFFLWIVAFCLFLLVETIEIKRLVSRILKYGIHFGIGIYHVSQWSRNFTFGTFFMFTYLTTTNIYINSFFHTILQYILSIEAWVIISLLIIQSLLFFKDRIHWHLFKVLYLAVKNNQNQDNNHRN